MKPPTMKTLLITPIILTALAGGAHAAGYVMDLGGTSPNQELVPNPPLPGIDGWEQSEANFDPNSPMAWIAGMGTNTSIGFGPRDFAPQFDPFFIRRDVSLGMAGSSLAMNMQFIQSIFFLTHNDFYIALNDPMENRLFTLNFVAHPILGFRWDMNVNGLDSFGSLDSVDVYELSLLFLDNGLEIEYFLSVGERNTTPSLDSAIVPGDTDSIIGSLEFGVTTGSNNPDWGDNFMTFADVSLIPEPSTAVLTALGCLGLLRRTRKS